MLHTLPRFHLKKKKRVVSAPYEAEGGGCKMQVRQIGRKKGCSIVPMYICIVLVVITLVEYNK